MWRQRVARRDYLKGRHGAIVMQARYRGQVDRARVKKMQHAAAMLQSAVKRHLARKEVFVCEVVQKWAARTRWWAGCQIVWNGCLCPLHSVYHADRLYPTFANVSVVPPVFEGQGVRNLHPSQLQGIQRQERVCMVATASPPLVYCTWRGSHWHVQWLF